MAKSGPITQFTKDSTGFPLKTKISGNFGFQWEPCRILSKLSYGTTFCHRVSKVSELFSKINFSNDFGFFTVERYMLIVLGKIAKLVLRRLEAFVK